ncbi:32843_t:CDS:1, partial [Gigaspora margarita]
PVIKLLLLCNSSLRTLKIIGPRCRDKIEKIFEIAFESCPNIVDFSLGLISCNLDYLEISWISSLQYLILYQNHLVVNLKNMKLGDYLEKLAKLLPKYIKEVKIWMILQSGYEDEVTLDDLSKFFSNINTRSSFVLLEIVIPYNEQVVSKSIQFDEFGKPEEIG